MCYTCVCVLCYLVSASINSRVNIAASLTLHLTFTPFRLSAVGGKYVGTSRMGYAVE